MNRITWKNHIWALAVFAGLISVGLIHSYQVSKINLLCMMFFMPQVLVSVLMYVSLAGSLILLIKHVILHNREKNALEKVCYIICFAIFAFSLTDRVILGMV